MARQAKDWIILRTSGRNTIALAETLNEAGFTAWTPVERRMVRKHRSPSMDELALPIMPSFVFARLSDIADLLALSATLRKKQPDFSLMRFGHGFAVTGDPSLNNLRREEEKATERFDRDKLKSKNRDRVLPKGSSVCISDNVAFAGLEGIVERDDGKKALVCFGGRMEVEVESFVLRTDEDMKKAA